MNLLDTSTITMSIEISEEELRERLMIEAMNGLGLNPGNPSITQTKVLRGQGSKGGYRVLITRDMARDDTPRITGPK